MPGLIYRLDTPLSHGALNYQHINVFRIDMETKRDGALNEPYLSMYLAACDAAGAELKTYNEQGRQVAVGSSFVRLSMLQVTAPQKQAHRALMQALFDYLQAENQLAAGSVVEATE